MLSMPHAVSKFDEKLQTFGEVSNMPEWALTQCA